MSLPDTILIARPEPGATETARRVAAMGLTPLISPALTIEALSMSLPPAEGVAAVLVTSGNALPALPATFHNTPLFAVGDATAARAERLGFGRVASASGEAGALAALVGRGCAPNGPPLLLVSGQGQGMALASALRAKGFRVLRRAVYRSRPVRVLLAEVSATLRARQVRAALFFSAETARAFVHLIRREQLVETVRAIDAFAIGAAAGVALEALPWRRIGVAATPNQDAMLALLR